MPNYTKGKIYKIYNVVTDDIYIGCTTQLLCERMRGHREACKDSKNNINNNLYKAFNKEGIHNFYIELVETFNCNTKEELTAKEGQYIRKLIPTLNTKIDKRTLKEIYDDNQNKSLEQLKTYYYNNIEKILEQQKPYIKCNKDNIKEYRKQYYLDNKVKIMERQKVYRQEKKQKGKL